VRYVPSKLLLVCDATIEMGSGHVMRQITLAIALKSLGFDPVLFCHAIPDALVIRAQLFGIPVKKRLHPQDSPRLSQEIVAEGCGTNIFDGYEFLPATINEVFDCGQFVVLVDDNGVMANWPCHVILNQNLHAEEATYKDNRFQPELLMGISWALIRPEVVELASNKERFIKSGVFLSVGGTDPKGIAPQIRSRLTEVMGEEITATTGVLNGLGFSPAAMAHAMATSKAGIIACGTTTWEAICLQLSFVGLITAENQVEVGESLIKRGIAPIVDCRSNLDVELIVETFQRLFSSDEEKMDSTELVIDGGGALRSARRIMSLTKQ
jgi:UDP-2,4-diacetamido-2,4,6-trideoxy-beta-L-altropyranose hydrolase